MIEKLIDHFRLHHEKEETKIVIKALRSGVIFRGTNL